MKTFQGRVVAPGTVTAKALVSHGGLNTLASFQNALQFGDKQAKCGDQNNPDINDFASDMGGEAPVSEDDFDEIMSILRRGRRRDDFRGRR